ncbi:MAG: peptidase glycoprotease [Candidatus Solibacter sp.]|nr:peptidase glycoprotease [Candidatus Solibacter sp.]
MALIFAVDTTSEHGSLALLREGDLLEEASIHAPTGFSHLLYAEIVALFDRHAVTLRDVDCFASASGPGAFTGVRVSLACVKGLAEALGRPAVAVSNLEALARFGTAPLRAAVLDARRGDLYGAVYDSDGNRIAGEVVSAPAPWLVSLHPEVKEFVTQGFALDVPRARIILAPAAIAAQIARIAAKRFAEGRATDPAALDANYVRRADAELSWKE